MGTIYNTPIVQFNNLYSGGTTHLVATELMEQHLEKKLADKQYCSLPEYCLIEDKWKYLAGVLK